ncbi:MAG: ABC transporter ATP-binding protein [Phycisphaerales bacterium JB059]
MIQTRDIRVDYGDVTAVSDLSLSVGPGEVLGLIGPNGAGKTSLISVLATLREPTYGDARIAGLDIFQNRAAVRRVIGYMPDLAPVYKDLRCWEFLDLFARAYFIDRRERRARIDACIEIVNLGSKRTAMAGSLSRGMTQRLVLAKTLLHDPSVLLLDEPASGLDPIARIDLRNLLLRLGSEGKTVVISSHILQELKEFCSSVAIMEKGRLVLSGAIEEIVSDLNQVRRFVVETVGEATGVASTLDSMDGPSEIEVAGGVCRFALEGDDQRVVQVLAELVRSGAPVKGFSERRRGVEDVMMEIGASEVS